MEFLVDLENKVDKLIDLLRQTRDEKNRIQEELNEKDSKIQQLQTDNDNLQNELEIQKDNTLKQETLLNDASEKIINLIQKLETVE